MQPPSAGDIITLANYAYQLYDTYKEAPARYRGLSEDVKGLGSVLKALQNGLRLQEQARDPGLTPIQSGELQQLCHQARELLEELDERLRRRATGFNRFRWGQKDVDSLRHRITSTCSLFAALNTSIVLSKLSSGETAK